MVRSSAVKAKSSLKTVSTEDTACDKDQDTSNKSESCDDNHPKPRTSKSELDKGEDHALGTMEVLQQQDNASRHKGISTKGTITKKGQMEAKARREAALEKNVEFNVISRYEERTVVPHLTLYDIERKPRKSQKVICRQPLNSLNHLFQCPVCLGYMKKTFIVMECLHRFCGGCIQKCLRVGKKECPSCRVHIPSRRSLRPDSNYDALMTKIFGDVEALESVEDKSIETYNRRNNMNNAYTTRRSRDMYEQEKNRKMKYNKNRDGSKERPPNPMDSDGGAGSTGFSSGSRNRTESTNSPIENLQESKLVNFILRPHPQVVGIERLHRECIRTSEDISMHHLKRFLAKKLLSSRYQQEDLSHSQFQILTTVAGRYVVLDDEIKLRDVRDEISDVKESAMLKLHYRRYTLKRPIERELADSSLILDTEKPKELMEAIITPSDEKN